MSLESLLSLLDSFAFYAVKELKKKLNAKNLESDQDYIYLLSSGIVFGLNINVPFSWKQIYIKSINN